MGCEKRFRARLATPGRGDLLQVFLGRNPRPIPITCCIDAGRVISADGIKRSSCLAAPEIGTYDKMTMASLPTAASMPVYKTPRQWKRKGDFIENGALDCTDVSRCESIVARCFGKPMVYLRSSATFLVKSLNPISFELQIFAKRGFYLRHFQCDGLKKARQVPNWSQIGEALSHPSEAYRSPHGFPTKAN